jgi:hypothetical protein
MQLLSLQKVVSQRQLLFFVAVNFAEQFAKE